MKNNKNIYGEYKKDNEFDCPSCGNPLIESTRDRIKCQWCNQIIIPKSRRLNRFAEVVNLERKKNHKEES